MSLYAGLNKTYENVSQVGNLDDILNGTNIVQLLTFDEVEVMIYQPWRLIM